MPPADVLRPHNDPAPGELCPPSLRPVPGQRSGYVKADRLHFLKMAA